MLDVTEMLAARAVRYAVDGAMAAAVHGVVRASLDADAVVALQVREAHALRQAFLDAGYEAERRLGVVDDPIPELLEVRDRHRNRVDLLIGLRGMDPEALNRARRVALMGSTLRIVGREDFVPMKAFAGSPMDLADARAVPDLDRSSLDIDLLCRMTQRFGRRTSQAGGRYGIRVIAVWVPLIYAAWLARELVLVLLRSSLRLPPPHGVAAGRDGKLLTAGAGWWLFSSISDKKLSTPSAIIIGALMIAYAIHASVLAGGQPTVL